MDDEYGFGRQPFDVCLLCAWEQLGSGTIPTLRNHLERRGLRCFLDRDMEPGESISEQLKFPLETSRYIVAVVSKNFLQRRLCRAELEYAYRRMQLQPWDSLLVILYDISVDEFKLVAREGPGVGESMAPIPSLDDFFSSLYGSGASVENIVFSVYDSGASGADNGTATWDQLCQHFTDDLAKYDLREAVVEKWQEFLRGWRSTNHPSPWRHHAATEQHSPQFSLSYMIDYNYSEQHFPQFSLSHMIDYNYSDFIRRGRQLYNEALSKGKERPRRIRLFICGPCGVGKTSILRSLQGKPFKEEYDSTEGIDAFGCIDTQVLGDDLNFQRALRQYTPEDDQSYTGNHDHIPLLPDSEDQSPSDLVSFVFPPDPEEDQSPSDLVSFDQHGYNPTPAPTPGRTKAEDVPNPNETIVTVWDFAGQIEYHCMHQLFFRSDCLYLLVLDLQQDGAGRRSTEEAMLRHAKKWLNAIFSSAGPGIGLVVVGTHGDKCGSMDLAEKRLDSLLKRLKEMVGDVDYALSESERVVVDNKNGIGIDVLQSRFLIVAQKLLDKMPDFPLGWLRLLEELKLKLPLEKGHFCVNSEKVKDLAKPYGINQEDKLRAALLFFDRVGEMVYIPEGGMSQWVFPQPQLLLDAMKSLLLSPSKLRGLRFSYDQCQQLESHGFFDNRMLEALWTDHGYKDQSQLRKVLALSGLIMEFEDGVVVPSRLQNIPEQWPITKEAEKELVVTTQYSTHLPPSLFGHILAGLHQKHGYRKKDLRLLSQCTSCIQINPETCSLGDPALSLRAIVMSDQNKHAIVLRLRAILSSGNNAPLLPDLVTACQVLINTLHQLTRERFDWLTVESYVGIPCTGAVHESLICKSDPKSWACPSFDSIGCPQGFEHSMEQAVKHLGSPSTSNAHSPSEATKSSNLLTTQCLVNGVNEDVGELRMIGLDDPRKVWGGKFVGNPYIFLSHRGPDTKETIIRPTHWFLAKILGVKAFFDDESMEPGDEKMRSLLEPAHSCSLALVLLSPHFRESDYCVMELNTFMERWSHRNLVVIPALWEVENVDGYAPALSNLNWMKSRTSDPGKYMVEILWPHLIEQLSTQGHLGGKGRPDWQRIQLERYLVRYVEKHRGMAAIPPIPSSLECFASEHPQEGCTIA